MSGLTIEEEQASFKTRKVFDNAVVVANVIELVTSVIARVDGKDVAYASGNDNLSRSVLGNMVASRVKNKLVGVTHA